MKSKYKIVERTLYSNEKEYVIKVRLLWFLYITHTEDMGMFISVSIYDSLRNAERKIEELIEKRKQKRLRKIKSIREI